MRRPDPALAPDAAIALGIASTAMPFARTHEAILERWLRILRLYGDAASALQALGVGEDRLQTADTSGGRPERGAQAADSLGGAGGVERVSKTASAIARELGDEQIATRHLLLAVMRLYGSEFDRVLAAHGCYRGELIERLGVKPAFC